MKESVIPKKLSDELEDVAKVYNSKSGMVVYPNSLSRLRTEIMKVCNEKQIAEKHILELIADKGKLIDEVNELKQKNDELEKENAILKKALNLYVDWADECGIAWDNFPDMTEKWYKVVEEKGLGWIDGLIFMVTEEAKEQLSKEQKTNG